LAVSGRSLIAVQHGSLQHYSDRRTCSIMNASQSRSTAIATPHDTATDIGASICAGAGGGNAVDAAIAASFALSVTYPHNTSIGGDLIALVKTPDGKIRCINASGTAAGGTDVDGLRGRFGSTMPVRGVDTVTVPGALSGLAALHRVAGRAPWEKLVTPAAILAEEGTPVADSLSRALEQHLDGILDDAGMSAVFAPEGTPLAAGDVLHQPDLARTLRSIASEGVGVFYEGDVGSALVAGLRALGSVLSEEDFRSYASTEAPVLSNHCGGFQVHTSGLNTQGFLLPQVLGAGEFMDAADRHAGAMAALWVQANRDRDRLLSDPAFNHVSETDVLNEEYLRDMAQRAASWVSEPFADAFPQPRGDTVAIVAADDEGYAVCVIQSVFHPFGSMILEPRTGILLHNRGSFFSLDPAHLNVIAPGKRPGHTLMPVMVTEDEDLRWVIGTMGGKAQPQIHFQVLRHLLDGSAPVEAVSRPRWIVGGMGVDHEDNALYCESDVSVEDREALEQAGFHLTLVPPHSEMLGHANIVQVSSIDKTLAATSDPRSDGVGRTVTV
jgi:gamma-glutamyltranspeptidase